MDVDIISDMLDGPADTAVPAPVAEVAAAPDQQVRKIDDTPKPAAEKPKSVRDTISDALKADTAALTPDSAKIDTGERVRNPDGTFAPKPAADPAAPIPAAAPVLAAPQGIDPQVFSSLPAETQAQLARTMEDVQKGQQRFAALAPIEQLIAPRIDAWAMGGMQPAQALHQLLALSDFAGKDPAGFIKYIAQANNVDLEALVLGTAPEEHVDPAIAALQKELSELRGERTQEQQRQAQAMHEQTVDAVLAFADEKDGQGNLLRPYLSELGKAWLPYIDMVKKQNPNWQNEQVLQQAYENACWANSNVRGKMQEATNKAAEAERLRKEAERVEAARTASATVRTGTPTTTPKAPDDASRTVRETIKAAMAAHS